MVTAIIIPIICFYFFWLTKKEMKENDQKWLSLTQIHEEAIVTGEIVHLIETKMRFYYHRYILVTDIQLHSETRTINVSRILPYTKHLEPITIKVGDHVKLYGNWKEDKFRFLRYEVENK